MKYKDLNLRLACVLSSIFLVSAEVTLASASSCDDHLSNDSFREYIAALNIKLSKISSKTCSIEVHCDKQSKDTGVVTLALTGNCDPKTVNEKTIKSAVDDLCNSVVKKNAKSMKCVSGRTFEDEFFF